MSLDKIIVVTKKTDLEDLLFRHATVSQARFYIESRGKDFKEYQENHNTYQGVLSNVIKNIPNEYQRHIVDKTSLATHKFDSHDILVVVGDPGLFVNVAKYAEEQPIICINGNPSKYEDIFTSCKSKDVKNLIYKTSDAKASIEKLTMAEAILDDGQKLLALNDIFVGKRTHASAKYILSQNKQKESQSSSGIVVSTGTGSTAWINSIVKGAYKIAGIEPEDISFNRESNHLLYFVREPFQTKTTGCEMITGRITLANPLNIISLMTENGVIFSDGIEDDYISFNSGCSAVIKPSETKVHLVKT